MITNMQIVNHVREDGWQILAIFNLDRWGGWPCQLVSHPDEGVYRVKGLSKPNAKTGICSLIDLNDSFADEAAKVYDTAMTDIFGEDWYKITDGRNRVMEWKPRKDDA